MTAAIVYQVRRESRTLQQEWPLVNALAEQYTVIGREVEETAPDQTWPALRRAVAKVPPGGILLIVRCGRLKWSPSFLQILSTSQVNFLCGDNPHLWQKNVHIQLLAATNRAQGNSRWQRDHKIKRPEFDSQTRLSDARFEAGVKQGGRNSGKARSTRASAVYDLLLPEMRQHRAAGKSFADVAQALNESGHLTVVGTPFSASTVFRIMQRAQ